MNSSIMDRKTDAFSPSPTGGLRRKRRLLFAFALFLVFAAAAAAFLYINALAYQVCRAEAGTEVLASDFIRNGDPEAFFTDEGPMFDIYVPGEYHVAVKSGLFTHRCTLIIEDSTPPKAQPSPFVVELGQTCTPEDLISDVSDISPVNIEFVSVPDFTLPGVHQVDIILSDSVGNSTVVSSELTVSPFVLELSREAGSAAPRAEDFALAAASGQLVTRISEEDMSHVADYPVTLSYDGQRFPSTLHVTDTTAPVGEPQNVTTCTMASLEAERFVLSVEDATDVTASFQTEPNMEKAGTQQVRIVLTDEGGNKTVLFADLELVEDTTPPVILGAHDIEILEGETISYRRNVTVKDDFEEEVALTVDSSGVDVNKAGEYTALYIATDVNGNSTELSIKVIVHPWSVSQEETIRLADEVLAGIITEDLTDLEKVNEIYEYIVTTIRYSDHSEKGDWAKAAYEGLHDHKGDCYVFACTAKLLLTRAGITNMDIEKSTASGNHYWNLIDLGGGWYHFDTTPRMDHPKIIMWTDEQLMYYSSRNANTHDYDHSLYPNIN